VENFCVAPGRTRLQDDELVVALHVPPVRGRSGSTYVRFTPRNDMDIAVVGVGASLVLDDDDVVTDARVALGAVGPTPLLVVGASTALVGNRVSSTLVDEVANLARHRQTHYRCAWDKRAPDAPG
jgi:carbon-monoxide dehydrogenase medium subunit